MSETPHPHDAIFRAVFSEPQHLVGELQAVLAPTLVARIDWSTFRREAGSYVDEDLRGRYTDLLCSAQLHTEGRRRAFLYVLLEHQSKPEAFMVLRIFNYMGRIWEQFRKDNKEAKLLPGIVPVVVHQGQGGWTAATRFEEILDLDPAAKEALDEYIPSFGFALDDLGRVSNEAIRSREMMSAYARLALFFLKNVWNLNAFLQSLLTFSDLIQRHLQTSRGLDDFVMLLRYYTQVNDGVPEPLRKMFREAAGPQHEEAVMTMWDRLQEEGEIKGLAKGRAEGKAESVLAVLTARGFSIPDELRAHVLACHDIAQLERWLTRALTATSPTEAVTD